jgi:hypothetical protein
MSLLITLQISDCEDRSDDCAHQDTLKDKRGVRQPLQGSHGSLHLLSANRAYEVRGSGYVMDITNRRNALAVSVLGDRHHSQRLGPR